MTSLPRHLLEVAAHQHGLLTARSMADGEVRRHTRARLVRQGLLEPVHAGVYRLGGQRQTFEQQCLAACLASPIVVVSGTSAGRLSNLRRMPDGPVHVMTPGTKLELNGVVVHRTNALGPGDIRRRADGIRVLAPARLVPDLARFLDDADLESVIEQLIDRGATSVPSLLASARRLRVTGRDGTVRLARVLDSRPAWMKPKDSDLEVRVLWVLAERCVDLEPHDRRPGRDPSSTRTCCHGLKTPRTHVLTPAGGTRARKQPAVLPTRPS